MSARVYSILNVVFSHTPCALPPRSDRQATPPLLCIRVVLLLMAGWGGSMNVVALAPDPDSNPKPRPQPWSTSLESPPLVPHHNPPHLPPVTAVPPPHPHPCRPWLRWINVMRCCTAWAPCTQASAPHYASTAWGRPSQGPAKETCQRCVWLPAAAAAAGRCVDGHKRVRGELVTDG